MQERVVQTIRGGLNFAEEFGYPVFVAPLFSSPGADSGDAIDEPSLIEMLRKGLGISPVHKVLIMVSSNICSSYSSPFR
jgi:carbamoyl-phosphate synthase large subunit